MKEFIEKLIKRLREEKAKSFKFELEADTEYSRCYFNGKRNAFAEIIEIAEEYESNLSESLTSWIPVTERLPEDSTDVLICSGEFVHEAYFEDGHFSNAYGMWYKAVTHWQPLPELYKEEKPAKWKDAVMNHFMKVD